MARRRSAEVKREGGLSGTLAEPANRRRASETAKRYLKVVLWERENMLRRIAVLMGAVSLIVCGGVRSVSAQGTSRDSGWRFEPGIGVSYFSSYVYEDPETQYWGVDLVARVGPTLGQGLEVGYTYVPQGTTTSHSSPRLHVFRVMAVRAFPAGAASAVALRVGFGAAALVMRPQRIDCGDFPICSEWAPRGGTRLAPMVGAGFAIPVASRVAVHGDLRAFRPVGDEWAPFGDPKWVTEVCVGVRVPIG